MKKEIMVDDSLTQTRLAVLEDERLAEIYVEKKPDKNILGNIYRGKVKSVLPGMQAAFVDIGLDRNAFLYVDDIIYNKYAKKEKVDKCVSSSKIEHMITSGHEITVQVIKDSFGNKGPRVTTNISLPGTFLVLLPNTDYVGVSRRIVDKEERNRLKEIASKLDLEGMGLIVRTAASGKSLQELKEDINFLKKHWKTIIKKETKGVVPRCLHKELSLVNKSIRDMLNSEVDRVVINNYDLFNYITEITKDNYNKVKIEYYEKQYNMFEYYHIESQIREALSKKVWLKSGGYLIFDKTEALTVIDVNTGKYIGNDSLAETVFRTNIEAANEIAHQIRLRDIGGIIIIDFIDMKAIEEKNKIVEELKQAVKRDKTKTSIVGMTGLGLIEMTRKKERQSLLTTLTDKCPRCGGIGRVESVESSVGRIEAGIMQTLNKDENDNLVLEVNSKVADYIKIHGAVFLNKIKEEYNKNINIKINNSIKQNQYILKVKKD